MLKNMPVSKKIIKHLEEKKYKFELIEHKTTYTAFDTAQTSKRQQKKIKPEEVVKALVVKIDKGFALALVSSNKKLDKKKLLKVVNALRKKNGDKTLKSVDLAREAWMKKNILGKVGATPPFKALVNLDVYIDNILAKQKNLYLGSGEYEFSIKVSGKEYLKKEEPAKGGFGVRK